MSTCLHEGLSSERKQCGWSVIQLYMQLINTTNQGTNTIYFSKINITSCHWKFEKKLIIVYKYVQYDDTNKKVSYIYIYTNQMQE